MSSKGYPWPHTGFKGSWLSLWLARLGARLADYLQETRPDREELARGEVSWPDLLIV